MLPQGQVSLTYPAVLLTARWNVLIKRGRSCTKYVCIIIMKNYNYCDIVIVEV